MTMAREGGDALSLGDLTQAGCCEVQAVYHLGDIYGDPSLALRMTMAREGGDALSLGDLAHAGCCEVQAVYHLGDI